MVNCGGGIQNYHSGLDLLLESGMSAKRVTFWLFLSELVLIVFYVLDPVSEIMCILAYSVV